MDNNREGSNAHVRQQCHAVLLAADFGLELPAADSGAADVCSPRRAHCRPGEHLLMPLIPANSPQQRVCRAVHVCDGLKLEVARASPGP